MYTVYEIPGVKVGVTADFTRRQEQQKDLGEMIRLEDHIDIYKASERERELQADKGYKVDKVPYWYVRQVMQEKAKTPEAKSKRNANTDYKTRTANTDYKAMVAKKDYVGEKSHLQRGVVAIDPEGIETTYLGMAEAARQLTKKTGTKFYAGGISAVCSTKLKSTHSNGWGFKYA